ncbi:MAG: LytTR family DNA-binding domain-containing protein, partial [Oscillospiraceae bacterium]
IGICDDEKEQIEYLLNFINKWAKTRDISLQTDIFYSAEEFLLKYDTNKSYDILLLDIQMDKVDGINLAKKIRENNQEVQIIFITGFPDFMSQGYDVFALHYLIKPVGQVKLFEVLDIAVQRLDKNKNELFLNIDSENIRMPTNNILYIEAQGHYIVISTITKDYRIKMNLVDIQNSLGERFLRCQRSFIVNLSHIKKTNRTTVFLTNGKQIPISRGMYDNINKELLKYFK